MSKNLSIEVHYQDTDKLISVGKIYYNATAASCAFRYNNEWLEYKHKFWLEPSLCASGMFYSSAKQLFSFMSDSMPDRWGRKLIDTALREGNTELQKLEKLTGKNSDLFYLLAVDDETRLGALRYSLTDSGQMLGCYKTDKPLTLAQISDSLNDTELSGKLLVQGSSMGGARPKAVIKTEGELWLAKFSGKNDIFNVPVWEYVNLRLAKDCGINTPQFRLERCNGKAVLLVKRFDRQGQTRIQFMSAKTLLGALEMERRGYIELACAFEEYCENAANDSKELWKRAMFNILVTNVDDHLKNHALLKTAHGWQLSPVYDLESTPPAVSRSKEWCMGLFDGNDRNLTIEKLLEARDYFSVTEQEADSFLSLANSILKNFSNYAAALGIKRDEINLMRGAYQFE